MYLLHDLYLICKSISKLNYQKTCHHTVAVNVVMLRDKCNKVLFICVLLFHTKILKFSRRSKKFPGSMLQCWCTFSSLVTVIHNPSIENTTHTKRCSLVRPFFNRYVRARKSLNRFKCIKQLKELKNRIFM